MVLCRKATEFGKEPGEVCEPTHHSGKHVDDLDARPTHIVLLQVVPVGNLAVRSSVVEDSSFDLVAFLGCHVIQHGAHVRFVGLEFSLRGFDQILLVFRRRLFRLPFLSLFHHLSSVLLRHDPGAFHADRCAFLVPAKLAAFPRDNIDGAISVVGTGEIDVGVVVDGSTKESFTRITRQTSKMHALGFVATHPTDSRSFGVSRVPCVPFFVLILLLRFTACC